MAREYGLLRMAHATRSGRRRVQVPKAMFDQIELKIAIQGPVTIRGGRLRH